MLEFDQKRVHYSYAPGYDYLKETLARENSAAVTGGSNEYLAGSRPYMCVYTCVCLCVCMYSSLFLMGTVALYRVCSTGLR